MWELRWFVTSFPFLTSHGKELFALEKRANITFFRLPLRHERLQLLSPLTTIAHDTETNSSLFRDSMLKQIH